MDYQGIIVRWNDERGFGFIQESQSATEIFAHISAFSERMPRPQQGEAVGFGIITNAKGKKEAQNIVYLNRPKRKLTRQFKENRHTRNRQSTSGRRDGHRNGVVKIVNVMIALLVISIAYSVYSRWQRSKTTATYSSQSSVQPLKPAAQPKFSCDGRKYCSQMRSCEEAEFFLRNCPNTEMDGDRDGIPCESQWCSR